MYACSSPSSTGEQDSGGIDKIEGCGLGLGLSNSGLSLAVKVYGLGSMVLQERVLYTWLVNRQSDYFNCTFQLPAAFTILSTSFLRPIFQVIVYLFAWYSYSRELLLLLLMLILVRV